MEYKTLKKRTLMIFAFIFILLYGFININISLKANNIPTTEFLPVGINYINESNIIYRPVRGTNNCTIETVKPMKVKSETSYGFYLYYKDQGVISEFTVKGYNSEGEYIQTIENTILDSTQNRKFLVGSDVKYISFKGTIIKNDGASIVLSNIKNNYFMIEYNDNKDFYSYTAYELEYKGPDYSEYSISDGTARYVTYMSSPISVTDLNKLVIACDNYDGIITNEIEIVNNKYSPLNKAGIYPVDYYISDSAGNEAELVLNVQVIDDVAPYIMGTKKYTTNQLEKLSVEDIKNTLTATDNNDGDITDEIGIYEDNYTGNEENLGLYEVIYFVEDAAGNFSSFTVTIEVLYKDIELPVFSGKFNYEIKNTETLSIDTILSNITVTDNVDGDLKGSVNIIYDDFTMNVGKIGKYTITLEACDTASNKVEQNIIINIVDGTPPIFIFNTKKIYVSIDEKDLNTDTIIHYLVKTNNFNQSDTYEVIEDEYTENKNTLGVYQVVYRTNDTETRVLVNVVEDLYDTDKDQNIFEKIWSFFKNLFIAIAEFFRRLFR